MAVRRRRVPTTLIQVCTVQPVKVRTLTATGGAPSRYGAISGRRPHIEQTRKGLRQAFAPLKEEGALVIAEQTEIAASSHRARTTTSTPARTETFTARTRAGVGRRMTTVAGRTQVPSRPRIPRMQH